MSRTDVHVPYRVKQRDSGWAHAFREEHDHRRGACDLADHNPADWQATSCHIGVVNISRNIHCGCGLCTGQPGRKLARKQERVAWRRVRQQVLSLTDRSDVDVPRLRGPAY